jgi:hypothetical protein
MPVGVYIRTQEHKRKVSEALKGHPVSDETRRKIREILLDRHPFRGKHFSESHRQKISIALSGKGPLANSWEGGIKTGGDGRIYLFRPDHPRAVEGHRYVARAHLVWEEHYGSIPDGLIIHHKNCDNKDDGIENLEAMTLREHGRLHAKLKKE